MAAFEAMRTILHGGESFVYFKYTPPGADKRPLSLTLIASLFLLRKWSARAAAAGENGNERACNRSYLRCVCTRRLCPRLADRIGRQEESPRERNYIPE